MTNYNHEQAKILCPMAAAEVERLRGLATWLVSGDTGISSEFMCEVFMGILRETTWRRTPADPSDFGRCLRLLDAYPEGRERLEEVADAGGKKWQSIVDNWEEMEALYHKERPTGEAPILYQMMKDMGL